MGIAVKKKSYGAVDRRALINKEGLNEGIGCTCHAADFASAAGVKDGIVPALYPVQVDGTGKAMPWTTGALSGLLVDGFDTAKGDASVAFMFRGVVDPTLLPVDCSAGTGSQLKFVPKGA